MSLRPTGHIARPLSVQSSRIGGYGQIVGESDVQPLSNGTNETSHPLVIGTKHHTNRLWRGALRIMGTAEQRVAWVSRTTRPSPTYSMYSLTNHPSVPTWESPFCGHTCTGAYRTSPATRRRRLAPAWHGITAKDMRAAGIRPFCTVAKPLQAARRRPSQPSAPYMSGTPFLMVCSLQPATVTL